MSQHYRREIDGLRAIAVSAVIVSHMGYPFAQYLPGGFIGVDIFFVISGFLITGILYRELQADRFSFWDFYDRRARRILPALLLVCVVSFPFAWVLMSPQQFAAFSQSLVSIGLFASNFYFWLTSDYFAPSAEEMAMLHTWSLAVEEQFYVFFPLVFLALWRRGRMVVGLSLGLLVSLALAELWGRLAPQAGFYLVLTRAWELLAGSLAGYCVARYGLPDGQVGPALWRGIGKFRGLLGGLAALGLGVSLVFYHHDLVVPGLLFVLPVGSTVLLLICVYGSGGLLRVLASGPMVAVGLISYSMYLWHQPVFALLRLSQLSVPSAGQMLLALAAVVGLAWLSWAFVEQPFRRIRSRRQVAFGGLVAAMAVLVGVGLAGHLRDGFPEARFAASTLQSLQAARQSPLRGACHDKSPQDACHYNSEFPARVTVLGDSHAVELAYALSETMADHQIGTVHLTGSGCPPALTFPTNRGGCSNWLEGSVALLEAAQPGVVVLSYRHAAYLYGRNEIAKPPYPALPDASYRIDIKGASEAEKRAAYWASVKALVDRLRAAGHQIVLLVPPPEIVFPIERYVLRRAAEGLDIASVPRAYYEARIGPVRDSLEKIAAARPGVALRDPADVFCDADTCYAMRAGTPLYYDDDHPSLPGAELIVEAVLGDLQDLGAGG